MIAHQKKIIIIDDDDRNIFALNAVLKARGYQCVGASSGQEGLELLRTQPKQIGIVLVDIMMPEMDGYQIISKIRKEPDLEKIPLVAVTAQAMVGDRERCLQSGADNYISKPINVDKLIKIIEEHI